MVSVSKTKDCNARIGIQTYVVRKDVHRGMYPFPYKREKINEHKNLQPNRIPHCTVPNLIQLAGRN